MAVEKTTKTKKKKTSPSKRRLPSLLQRTWKIVAGLLVAGLLVGGGVALWSRLGPGILAGEEYVLRRENIEINAAPDWVRADVVEEVITQSGLVEMNITDPDLAVAFKQAFELHPWIASVEHVAKKVPARLVVLVEYRRPVAMVEVSIGGEPGLLPVDESGILLPPDDFSPNDAAAFPRIVVEKSLPVGPVGTSWGDRRVTGAVMIIAMLEDHWDSLGLHHIVSTTDLLREDEPVFELVSDNGTQVHWGHMPGHETANEADVSIKVARLVRYIAEHGPIGAAGTPAVIDISAAAKTVTTPRTATLP